MSDEEVVGGLDGRVSILENRICALSSDAMFLRGKMGALDENVSSLSKDMVRINGEQDRKRDALAKHLGEFEREAWRSIATAGGAPRGEAPLTRTEFEDEMRNFTECMNDFQTGINALEGRVNALENPPAKSALADAVCREAGEEEKSSAKASVALLHQRLDKIGEKLVEMECRLGELDKFREVARDVGRFAFDRINALEWWMDWVFVRLVGGNRMKFDARPGLPGATVLVGRSDREEKDEEERRRRVREMQR